MLIGSIKSGAIQKCDLSTGNCSPIDLDGGNSKGLTSLTVGDGGEITVSFFKLYFSVM